MANPIRVGLGLDFHKLKRGESLILGGVEYDFPKGTVAFSDGDVLIHAICDAILGAAGLGDIGVHFPDNDPAYHNISSLKLLSKVVKKIAGAGYKVRNVDSTLVLQEPNVSSRREEMVENIERIVSAPVNIKATTPEKMGFIGSGDGVGGQAIAAVEERVD